MLSNVSSQNVPTQEPVQIPPPPEPVEKVTPPEQVINELDLALSNDYKSLRYLEQMIKSSPENVLPPGDAPRLLSQISTRIREMGEDEASRIVRTDKLQSRVMALLEQGYIDNTLQEMAS